MEAEPSVPHVHEAMGEPPTDMICRRGVKQGCPFSPILFDLALEQLVSGLEGSQELGYGIGGEEKVTALAYTDDLCLMANSPEQLQTILDWATDFAS